MSRITLDLLRKRSEHNEGEISTLEEIALHQENIEKIELIDRTCRHLRILLLQNNLISRIENLARLKSLEYLNLALNNIEAIENLQELESLRKLDLTVNFIGNLRGIKTLRCNEHLEQLFLMGNPCADYQGYKEYTIATLMQLKELDGTPIERSERIKALQNYAEVEGEIIRGYATYKKTRETELIDYRERTARSSRKEKNEQVEGEGEGEGEVEEEEEEEEKKEEKEEDDEEFWNRPSRHTPEERVAIAERFMRKEKRRENREKNRREPRITYKLKLFDSNGKPYNMNQPKVPFKLDEEQHDIVLEVTVFKYLDTCYVDVDVNPDYVRVTIKGKILQLTLPCEVSVNESTARRNTTNGKLAVTMPRLNPLPTIIPKYRETIDRRNRRTIERRSATSVREYLEIGPVANDLHDFSRIVVNDRIDRIDRIGPRTKDEKISDDDSEVPPLE